MSHTTPSESLPDRRADDRPLAKGSRLPTMSLCAPKASLGFHTEINGTQLFLKVLALKPRIAVGY